MSYQHKGLAAGAWAQLSLSEQMANIGSEVERAINWRVKKNEEYAQRAFERALELIGLSLNSRRSYARLKEFTRLKEALVDYFFGKNEFKSSARAWQNYFLPFFLASRKGR